MEDRAGFSCRQVDSQSPTCPIVTFSFNKYSCLEIKEPNETDSVVATEKSTEQESEQQIRILQ